MVLCITPLVIHPLLFNMFVFKTNLMMALVVVLFGLLVLPVDVTGVRVHSDRSPELLNSRSRRQLVEKQFHKLRSNWIGAEVNSFNDDLGQESDLEGTSELASINTAAAAWCEEDSECQWDEYCDEAKGKCVKIDCCE